MIRITLWRDGRGRLVGFRAEGHSGWASRGSDIVCAAVSALTQAAALGLVQHLRLDVTIRADDGFLECRLPGMGAEGGPRGVGDVNGRGTLGRSDRETAVLEQADAVLAAMALGLKEVAARYPRQVAVEERMGGS